MISSAKAYRLRKKDSLTDDEQSSLDEYSATVKRGRPPGNSPGYPPPLGIGSAPGVEAPNGQPGDNKQHADTGKSSSAKSAQEQARDTEAGRRIAAMVLPTLQKSNAYNIENGGMGFHDFILQVGAEAIGDCAVKYGFSKGPPVELTTAAIVLATVGQSAVLRVKKQKAEKTKKAKTSSPVSPPAKTDLSDDPPPVPNPPVAPTGPKNEKVDLSDG